MTEAIKDQRVFQESEHIFRFDQTEEKYFFEQLSFSETYGEYLYYNKYFDIRRGGGKVTFLSGAQESKNFKDGKEFLVIQDEEPSLQDAKFLTEYFGIDEYRGRILEDGAMTGEYRTMRDFLQRISFLSTRESNRNCSTLFRKGRV